MMVILRSTRIHFWTTKKNLRTHLSLKMSQNQGEQIDLQQCPNTHQLKALNVIVSELSDDCYEIYKIEQ